MSAATVAHTAMRKRRSGYAAAFVSALAAVFALRRLDDFDTWWHLAAGRWIVANGRAPDTDTLSHTVPDHEWTNVQWLYDVLLYALHCAGGVDLVVLVQAASFAAAMWIVARSVGAFVGPVTTLIIGLATLIIAEARFMVRPEMVSFVLLAVVLHILLTMRDDDGRRLGWLPVVIAVWVNCHSLFIVGLFCIGAFAFGAVLARTHLLPAGWRDASDPGASVTRRLLLCAGLSVLATFLNPYFLRGALFPFELLSRLSGTGAFQAIGEFSPPFAGYFVNWSLRAFRVCFVASAVVLPVAAIVGLSRAVDDNRRGERTTEASGTQLAPRGFDFGAAVAFCGVAYLATLARRNSGLFAIVAAPIVASWIALLRERTASWVASSMPAVPARTGQATIVALAGAYVMLGVFVASNGYYQANGAAKEFGLGVFESNFPIRAARFAERSALPGKLYNDLTAGGYLTWHAGVSGGVYIDGRLEVYDEAFFADYLRALADEQLWQERADQFGVEKAIIFHRWPNRHPLITGLARDARWVSVYYDEVAIVFVRRAGNTDAIERAKAAFPEWELRTKSRLFREPEGWGAPVELATGLDAYARLLETFGASDRALEALLRALEIGGVNRSNEASLRVRAAWLLAETGDRADARRQAERALQLVPEDKDAREVLSRLDGLSAHRLPAPALRARCRAGVRWSPTASRAEFRKAARG